MTVATLRTHTAALIGALTAGGLTVGDANIPSGPLPNVVVYPRGAFLDGGLVEPSEDASVTWQITCRATTREQAEWLIDRCNALLEGQWLTVAGRVVGPIEPLLDGSGVERDDDVTPPVFYATPRYRAVSRPT